MPVLLQCPRCGFNYVKPLREANQQITCRRCQLVFTAAADPGAPLPPNPETPPPELFPFPVPVTNPATPTHFVLEPETVHEVEQIEVLDEPGAKQTGSLEIDAAPPIAPKFDDVEVLAPPPIPKPNQPGLPARPAEAEAIPTPAPALPSKPTTDVDHVEVVADPSGPAVPPVVAAATVDADAEREQPPPVPRRDRLRTLDIRKRPGSEAGVPVGVWLGLASGGVALLLLIVLLVVILRSGAPTRQAFVVQQQGPAAAPPPEQFLPPPQDWPLPPDQRGPAPWLPKSRFTAGQIPAATEFEGLFGYWPCDEGKSNVVADGTAIGHKSTLVGGWWIDGVRGKALLFDGRRDYLDLGNSALLNVPHNGPFTIAAWFATRQQNGYLLAFRNPRDFAPVIQLKLSGGALCGVVRADGSDSGEARVGLASAADGRWHHFALVRYAGGMIECFLDGQALDKRNGSNTLGPITTTVRAVGCERSWSLTQNTSAAFCACAIDELCIFHRALTAQEIAKLAGK